MSTVLTLACNHAMRKSMAWLIVIGGNLHIMVTTQFFDIDQGGTLGIGIAADLHNGSKTYPVQKGCPNPSTLWDATGWATNLHWFNQNMFWKWCFKTHYKKSSCEASCLRLRVSTSWRNAPWPACWILRRYLAKTVIINLIYPVKRPGRGCPGLVCRNASSIERIPQIAQRWEGMFLFFHLYFLGYTLYILQTTHLGQEGFKAFLAESPLINQHFLIFITSSWEHY